MLVEFRVKNFLSFKDEAVFSMLTSGNKEHPENLIPFDEAKGEYLTKVALLYGANASGKTNLLRALSFLLYYALESKKLSTSKSTLTIPFLFDEKTAKEPSSFEIKFIKNNIMYVYGLELDARKIHNEYLYKTPEGKFSGKPLKVFERTDNEEVNLNVNISKLKKKYLTESAHNRSYLSVAGFWEDPAVVEAYKWFEDNVKSFVPSPFVREDLYGYAKKRIVEEKGKPESQYLKNLVDIFKNIDIGISGLGVQKVEFEVKKNKIPDDIPEEIKNKFFEALPQESIVLMTRHVVGKKEYALPFEFESSGTQKSLDLIGVLIDLIEKQGVLVIDELEESLHPELTKELLKQIQKSECNVQIIFTTHDPTLMDLNIFRKDQYWFTEKDRDKQTSKLFSLSEIQGVRSNDNIQKKYLSGRYGAFPYIKEFDKLLCQ